MVDEKRKKTPPTEKAHPKKEAVAWGTRDSAIVERQFIHTERKKKDK